MMTVYCVESIATNMQTGLRAGTFRFYTLDELKARRMLREVPGRTLVEMPYDQAPEVVRQNFERHGGN